MGYGICSKPTQISGLLVMRQAVSPRPVVMDFKLPGMDGIKATRLIKQMLPSVPIVMFTVREGDIYIEEAIAAGASAFVTKRAMGTELIPTLDKLLADAAPMD